MAVSVTGPDRGVLGTPYSQYLIPLGGTPPYTVVQTNIPAGLTVDNGALLSGTPQEGGDNLTVLYTISDSGGNFFETIIVNLRIQYRQ
jgi:hypothetical protein